MPQLAGIGLSPPPRAGGPSIVIDTRRALALANEAKAEATRMHAAILTANTRLAAQVQRAEARALREAVAGGGRPQRHGPNANKGLGRLLVDERNRTVTVDRIEVNNVDFLDQNAVYWRQLEFGAHRSQVLRGMFAEPRRNLNPNARYASPGNLAPPIHGDRSANRFLQYQMGRGGKVPPSIFARVGPREGYEYIRGAGRDITRSWSVTGGPVNTYRRAFQQHGLRLLSTFRSAHGRSVSGPEDLIGRNFRG